MNLLEMSFSGAVMILVVFVLRALLINKLPKKTFLILWAVIVLRFMLPFSFPSTFSVYSYINQNTVVANIMKSPSGEYLPDVFDDMEIKNNGGREKTTENMSVQKKSAFPLWTIIWLSGMLICAVFFTVTYILSFREFKTSLPVENSYVKEWQESHRLWRSISIRQSGCISSPLTYGIFRPVILMPKKTKWEHSKQLQYILAHEFVHIRRLDAVAKLFLTAAVCIHWFNPFVWFMYHIANRDLELSCDEAVLRHFGEGSRTAYALTLINME